MSRRTHEKINYIAPYLFLIIFGGVTVYIGLQVVGDLRQTDGGTQTPQTVESPAALPPLIPDTTSSTPQPSEDPLSDVSPPPSLITSDPEEVQGPNEQAAGTEEDPLIIPVID